MSHLKIGTFSLSMNIVILTGRLGKDPELRYTPKGVAYCRFTLATTERYSGQTKTLWNDIVAWGKLAEICGKHLSKGAKIGIRGRIAKSTWEKEGAKRTTTEIVIDELEFLGEKHQADQAPPETDSGLNLPF
jgi:single-strand DNA-binding protein